jgi:voltage-gated sodium channel
MRQKLITITEHSYFKRFIVAMLVINGITLGLETYQGHDTFFYATLHLIDNIILGILVVEVTMRIIAQGLPFFSRSWNLFDFTLTAIALVPAAGPFAVLRAFRILRLFRIFSSIPRIQKLVNTIVQSVPGIFSILIVLLIMFYVFAVIGTNLFRAESPEFFGNIGRSMFTLFQVMTGESWASGIARPIMETHPYSWIFFVSFLLITSITLLNLIIVVMLSSMQEQGTKKRRRDGDPEGFDPAALRKKSIDI